MLLIYSAIVFLVVRSVRAAKNQRRKRDPHFNVISGNEKDRKEFRPFILLIRSTW